MSVRTGTPWQMYVTLPKSLYLLRIPRPERAGSNKRKSSLVLSRAARIAWAVYTLSRIFASTYPPAYLSISSTRRIMRLYSSLVILTRFYFRLLEAQAHKFRKQLDLAVLDDRNVVVLLYPGRHPLRRRAKLLKGVGKR